MGQITAILSYAWEIILHVNVAEITVQPLDLDFFPVQREKTESKNYVLF